MTWESWVAIGLVATVVVGLCIRGWSTRFAEIHVSVFYEAVALSRSQ